MNELIAPILISLVSILSLFFGAKRLVVGSCALGYLFGVSQAMIGLTILAITVALPELYFSLQHDLPTYSNVANLGFVLGVVCLVSPLTIQSQLLKKATLFLAVGILIVAFLFLDQRLTNFESIAILILMLGLISWLIMTVIHEGIHRQNHISHVGIPTDLPIWQAVVSIMLGIILVFLGGYALESTSTVYAPKLQVFAECLPELMIALMAARIREPDLLAGMLIGSNSFNLLFTLPIVTLQNTHLVIMSGTMVLMVYQLLLTVMLFFIIRHQVKITRAMAGGLVVSFFVINYFSPLI